MRAEQTEEKGSVALMKWVTKESSGAQSITVQRPSYICSLLSQTFNGQNFWTVGGIGHRSRDVPAGLVGRYDWVSNSVYKR